MTEYIHSVTGEIKTERQILDPIRATTSISKNTIAELGYVPVLQAPAPTPSSPVKVVRRNGVTTDSLGNKVQAWIEVDMFSDIDGGPTKAEQEAEYLAKSISDAVAEFILQIDADADALIRAVIGERASQYEGAEREALEYKAAGYTGTVPPKVQAWATAKNETAQWAADSQIATADAWRSAENALYSKRLLLKENARNASDVAALNAIKAQWAGFIAALKTSLGVQ